MKWGQVGISRYTLQPLQMLQKGEKVKISEEQRDVILWVAKQYDYRLDGVRTQTFYKQYVTRCFEIGVSPVMHKSLIEHVKSIFDLPRVWHKAKGESYYVGGIREESRGEGEPWTPLNLE